MHMPINLSTTIGHCTQKKLVPFPFPPFFLRSQATRTKHNNSLFSDFQSRGKTVFYGFLVNIGSLVGKNLFFLRSEDTNEVWRMMSPCIKSWNFIMTSNVLRFSHPLFGLFYYISPEKTRVIFDKLRFLNVFKFAFMRLHVGGGILSYCTLCVRLAECFAILRRLAKRD